MNWTSDPGHPRETPGFVEQMLSDSPDPALAQAEPWLVH